MTCPSHYYCVVCAAVVHQRLAEHAWEPRRDLLAQKAVHRPHCTCRTYGKLSVSGVRVVCDLFNRGGLNRLPVCFVYRSRFNPVCCACRTFRRCSTNLVVHPIREVRIGKVGGYTRAGSYFKGSYVQGVSGGIAYRGLKVAEMHASRTES